MNLRQLMRLKAAMGSGGEIPWSDEAYSHENANKIKFIGNQYAFGNAKYADQQNYIRGYDGHTSVFAGTTDEVDIDVHDNIVILNGTNTSHGVIDKKIWAQSSSVDIPAGQYTFMVIPYIGEGSDIHYSKNMQIEFWYDGNETTTYSKAAVANVGKSAVTATVNLENHVYKIITRVGVTTNKYVDYRLFYGFFKSGVQITDTQKTVPADGSVDVSLPSKMNFIYSMMHKSKVK